ncbi:MAG: hypothetical protein MUP26_07075 [Desulfobulbaceae bacterium]|nr:hypothetical protein [Desulfobulbaceae bacterium]
MKWSYFFLPFALGCVFALVLTPLTKRLARKTGMVAIPKDNRWHRRETPLLGGVSIFCSMMAAWFLGAWVSGLAAFPDAYLLLLLCAGGIFALGLADDILNMDPQHKLAGQIIITSLLLFFGFRLDWTQYQTINLFLSILWIVGITNAFNLLDNMDGLSSGVAFISGAFLLGFCFLDGSPGPLDQSFYLTLGAFLGAILGFLVFNFNPASIFMGDAGSLFMGFTLACLTISGSSRHTGGTGFFNLASIISIPVLILFVPILDTGFVSIMRKLFRRRISQGGRDHSSHRLVAIGFSEKKAVLILYAFSVTSGLMALLINRLTAGTAIVIVILYLLFILFFWIYLARVKVYSEKPIIDYEGARGITTILLQITYRRRVFEVLLDLVLITVAYYTGYLLRFEGAIGPNFDFFLNSLPVVIACQVLFFYIFGVYRGVWEDTSIRDLIVYGKAITAGTVVPILILLFMYRFHSFSRAVFVIYWGLMMLMVSLSRLSFRLLDEGIRKGNRVGNRVLVYGAGLGGQMTMREIETNKGLEMILAGFMDDNPSLKKRKIRGYPVFGGMADLREVIEKRQIKEIIISFREKSAEKKTEIRNLCNDMGIDVRIKEMKLHIE